MNFDTQYIINIIIVQQRSSRTFLQQKGKWRTKVGQGYFRCLEADWSQYLGRNVEREREREIPRSLGLYLLHQI